MRSMKELLIRYLYEIEAETESLKNKTDDEPQQAYYEGKLAMLRKVLDFLEDDF